MKESIRIGIGTARPERLYLWSTLLTDDWHRLLFRSVSQLLICKRRPKQSSRIQITTERAPLERSSTGAARTQFVHNHHALIDGWSTTICGRTTWPLNGQVDVERPTRSLDSRSPGESGTSARRRLFVKVDCRTLARLPRPIDNIRTGLWPRPHRWRMLVTRVSVTEDECALCARGRWILV
jgi:hypothetical protein